MSSLKSFVLSILVVATRLQLYIVLDSTVKSIATNATTPKALIASGTTAPVSLTAQSLGNNQYQLSPEQCFQIDSVFEASELTSALYRNSCESRFIQVHRLYDGSLLLYISMNNWATEQQENRSTVNLGALSHQIGFSFFSAQLVVRVDGCLSLPLIKVRISPPPPRSSTGVAQVNINRGVGEHLVENNNGWKDVFVQLVEADTKCSLANSYLLVCGRNRNIACKIRLFDVQQGLVECHCDENGIVNYFLALVAFILLVLLIILSLVNCSQPQEEMGINEEKVKGNNVSSRTIAYKYQVIYRVACPTSDFDCQNSVMDFEVLGGSNFEPIYLMARFSLTNLSGIKWNIFTTKVFLATPMPKIKAVRVSHSRGTQKTGLFLFDVLVNFISGPETDAEENKNGLKPIIDESTIRNQQLKIFSYILDHPKVYLKAKKGAKLDMPPITYIEISTAVLKVLVWLAVTQTMLFAVILLDQLYLRFEMTMLSTGIALFIATVLSLELGIIVAVHSYLDIESLRFELLNENLAPTDDKSKKTQASINWYWYLNTALVLVLLLLIGGCMVAIALRLKQPLFKALYVEAIFILVLVLVGGGSWLLYETIDQWKVLKRERIITEERMMTESGLRGALLSSTYSETNEKETNSSASNTKKTASTSQVSPKLVKGTFEMM